MSLMMPKWCFAAFVKKRWLAFPVNLQICLDVALKKRAQGEISVSDR